MIIVTLIKNKSICLPFCTKKNSSVSFRFDSNFRKKFVDWTFLFFVFFLLWIFSVVWSIGWIFSFFTWIIFHQWISRHSLVFHHSFVRFTDFYHFFSIRNENKSNATTSELICWFNHQNASGTSAFSPQIDQFSKISSSHFNTTFVNINNERNISLRIEKCRKKNVHQCFWIQKSRTVRIESRFSFPFSSIDKYFLDLLFDDEREKYKDLLLIDSRSISWRPSSKKKTIFVCIRTNLTLSNQWNHSRERERQRQTNTPARSMNGT